MKSSRQIRMSREVRRNSQKLTCTPCSSVVVTGCSWLASALLVPRAGRFVPRINASDTADTRKVAASSQSYQYLSFSSYLCQSGDGVIQRLFSDSSVLTSPRTRDSHRPSQGKGERAQDFEFSGGPDRAPLDRAASRATLFCRMSRSKERAAQTILARTGPAPL